MSDGAAETMQVAKFERRMRPFWWVMLVIASILFCSALLAMLRAEPDAYPHQHSRLAANAAFGICLSASFIARDALRRVLMVAAVVAIAFGVFLQLGYAR